MKRSYPDAPIVAVGALIVHGDRIALVQRAHEPSRGKWTFPGGAVELGETVRDAVRREVLEETGLDVEVGEVVTVIDRVARDDDGRVRYHYVIVDFLAHPVGGTLRAGDDASGAGWFSAAELDELDMTQPAGTMARDLLALRAQSDS